MNFTVADPYDWLDESVQVSLHSDVREKSRLRLALGLLPREK
jgi:hypothetical protein